MHPPCTPEPLHPNPATVDRIRALLMGWFDQAGRDLPWRGTADPYAIWVSEVMLQQTQVETVIPYYQRFMSRFPTVSELACADEQEVLAVWAGLGYYSRARNLQAAARIVHEKMGAALPRTSREMEGLPGVGRYTANAVASLAFGESVPALDGNVMRVLCRLFRVPGDPKRGPTNRRLWDLAQTLVPLQHPGGFNSAIMELGARVCRPTQPDCTSCPVQAECKSHAMGDPISHPQSCPRPRSTSLRMVAAVVRQGEQYLMSQRPSTGRWAHMWQFPNGELDRPENPHTAVADAMEQTLGIRVEVLGRIARLTHAVTRFKITLDAYECRLIGGELASRGCADWGWISVADLDSRPVPSVHRRIIRVLEERPRGTDYGCSLAD